MALGAADKSWWHKASKTARSGHARNTAIAELTKALASVERTKQKSLWKHIVERAYEDDYVAIAIIKKLAPDLKQIDSHILSQISGGITLNHLSDEELSARISYQLNRPSGSREQSRSRRIEQSRVRRPVRQLARIKHSQSTD